MSPPAAATTILLVRHTEVENPERILYGRLSKFGLSNRGRAQARAVAVFLAKRPISAVYTGPLLRARQTASVIASYHPRVAVHHSSLLHEVGSAWQGEPLASFAPGFSTYTSRRALSDESIEDIRARMVAFVERVRRRHPGRCIVGVSHGDPITVLRLALSDRPVTLAGLRGRDYADLGSVTEIVLQPGDSPQVSYVSVPGLVDLERSTAVEETPTADAPPRSAGEAC